MSENVTRLTVSDAEFECMRMLMEEHNRPPTVARMSTARHVEQMLAGAPAGAIDIQAGRMVSAMEMIGAIARVLQVDDRGLRGEDDELRLSSRDRASLHEGIALLADVMADRMYERLDSLQESGATKPLP